MSSGVVNPSRSVIVAAKHHPDDVLANVVDIALYRRHDDPAFDEPPAAGLPLCFEVGLQVRDRLLHHARALHDLREEHPSGAEQIAHHVHPVHQRPFDDG